MEGQPKINVVFLFQWNVCSQSVFFRGCPGSACKVHQLQQAMRFERFYGGLARVAGMCGNVNLEMCHGFLSLRSAVHLQFTIEVHRDHKMPGYLFFAQAFCFKLSVASLK